MLVAARAARMRSKRRLIGGGDHHPHGSLLCLGFRPSASRNSPTYRPAFAYQRQHWSRSAGGTQRAIMPISVLLRTPLPPKMPSL